MAAPGAAVFTSAGCAGCHTLAAARATGAVGPNLDERRPQAAAVEAIVTAGGGSMPSSGTGCRPWRSRPWRSSWRPARDDEARRECSSRSPRRCSRRSWSRACAPPASSARTRPRSPSSMPPRPPPRRRRQPQRPPSPRSWRRFPRRRAGRHHGRRRRHRVGRRLRAGTLRRSAPRRTRARSRGPRRTPARQPRGHGRCGLGRVLGRERGPTDRGRPVTHDRRRARARGAGRRRRLHLGDQRGRGDGHTLDRASGEPVGAPIGVGGRPLDIAVDDELAWVTSFEDGTVTRIDTGSATLVGEPIAVGRRPRGVAVGEGSVWVANAGEDTVTRIDPVRRHRRRRPDPGRRQPARARCRRGLGVGRQRGRRHRDPDRVSSGKVAGEPIPTGDDPTGIAVGAGAVWTANFRDGTVTRIEP